MWRAGVSRGTIDISDLLFYNDPVITYYVNNYTSKIQLQDK